MITIVNKEPININPKQIVEPLLFETIKFTNQKFYNLNYHQKRVNLALKEFFKTDIEINLEKELANYRLQNSDLNIRQNIYRVKLIYSPKGIEKIEHYIYNRKTIKKIKLVELLNITYKYKYFNRDFLNNLNDLEVDEFIITQNGLITDSTIANIALFHKNKQQWHTAKEPLLFGTTLNRYLDKKKLITTDIHYKDLKNYSKIAFLNAMVDWVEYTLKE